MELKSVQNKIYEIRNQKVLLDFDLAKLYEVETRALNQAVKRNIDRFPGDFLFQISTEEWVVLKTQNSNSSQSVMSSEKHRGQAYRPFAFTEQGVAMLSSVLKSKKAIHVNIAIMRAFVLIRQFALSHTDLTKKLKEIETKYDKQFKDVYEAINYLLQKDKKQVERGNRKQIGYKK